MLTITKTFGLVGLVLLGCSLAGVKADPTGTGWTMAFNDEFNGQAHYDTTKWDTTLIWGGYDNGSSGELSWFQNTTANIDLSGGSSVKFTAIANNPVVGGVTRPYSTGCLSSHNHFNQAFGYWEVRAKLPSNAQGIDSIFWMLEGAQEGASYVWPPEIDIFEHITLHPANDYMAIHYPAVNYPLDGGASGAAYQATFTNSQDLGLAFHTYAIDWEPDSVTWYVDGVQRLVNTNYVPYLRAMHAILDLTVGGWGGNPTGSTTFPATYEVDYIRVWNKALPSPWVAADVGSPTNAGRTYASNTGLMNVMGSGAGITGSSDQFHYAYVPMSGDGTIITRIKNEVGTNSIYHAANAGTLAGVMIRETLNANSTYALMALEPVISGTAGGNVISYRTSTGGTATKTVVGNSQGVPSWVKLVRSGATFTGYSSPDGTTWTQNFTTTISMASSVYVGLAVTSNLAANRATAQFDSISIPSPTTPFVTGETLGSLRGNYNGSLGFKFTVGSAPVTVGQLGRWVVSGNSGSHTVELVRASDSAVIGSVSVNTLGATPGAFTYTTLGTPVTLSANTAYYLVSSGLGTDQWYDAGATTLTTTGSATINNAAYTTDGTTWNVGYSTNHSYIPVSFTTIPTPTNTPFVTGQTLSGTIRNNYAGSLGFKFTVGSSPMTVSQLGRWVIAGNTGTHTVELVRASDNAVLGSVSVNTAGATPGAFAYTALGTPVALAANTAYYVASSETTGGDQWYDQSTILTHASTAVINNAAYTSNGTTWNNPGIANSSYIPVAFMTTP